MALFSVHPLTPPYDQQWDPFIDRSNNGSIFHRRDFLSYHQQRFEKEEHPLVILRGTSLYGVLPAALFVEGQRRTLRSPYGGSFGGPVFANALNYEESRQIVEALLRYGVENSISTIQFTPAPGCYEQMNSETFPFCLLEQGFQITNQDITHCVDLRRCGGDARRIVTARARNMVQKAKKQDLQIVHQAPVSDLYVVLNRTYEKIKKTPTHTREEFETLNALFPHRVFSEVIYSKGKPIAGIGFIRANSRVMLTFYLATDPEHQQMQGQSLLIYESMCRLIVEGVWYLDFGTSSMQGKANPNLFLFKESFGATGHFRKTFVFNA